MNALRTSLTVGAMTLALVGLGAGAAWAGTPNPTPPRPVATTPAPRPAPGAVTGQVVRVDVRSLTLRGVDGRPSTFALNPRTEITRNGRKASAAQLRPGDRVVVTAVRTGNAQTATRVAATGR